MIQQHGTATYAILWTIVFCETGLVLTPFLPGDSLLFAAGAFAGEEWQAMFSAACQWPDNKPSSCAE
jgi:membrane protein DedA with SNARE-associated domain